MKTIENLDLKIQFTKEYLENGGYQKICNIGLLEELQAVRTDIGGKVNPETVGSRLRAFMNALLLSQALPPVQIDDYITEYESFVQKSNFFEQIQIETKEQVDDLFEKHGNSTTILFRGQNEAKWRLYSTIQRYWIWEEMQKKEIDFNQLLKKQVRN